MKRSIFSLTFLLLLGLACIQSNAQDRTVTFNVSDNGVSTPITWGLDLAWLSESNIRRGIAFMGADQIDLVRSSFTPTAPLDNGQLQAEELDILNQRLDIINTWLGPMNLVLNCDHPSVDDWFKNSDGTVNASRWAQLMDETVRLHEEDGHNVVTVSPFNEPDYGWDQGDMNDFYNIAGELINNSRFNDIRISGGNTLSSDAALDWYNYLQDRLDEGNTHQLAGSFDNYANFFETVRANGHHATADELHNVGGAIVGAEYGMQTGIWWGTAEYARGEFVKASDGVRLGYAEHRANWTAAAVYRAPDGKVQAFLGGSERQAATTTYKFVSEDKDVFFDGHGPQREYTITYPGGTGYQDGQTNAEKVINITWGEDVQPVIDGRYKLVNRNSGKVMEIEGASSTEGANLQQNTYSGGTHQQWDVTPVDSRVGGDFSYFTITAVNSGLVPDVMDWSLDDGANVIVWSNGNGGNQQWYLEYAEDGWFYIRNRHSSKCLDVDNNSTADGANIQQWEALGATNQQWRLLPVDAPIEFTAPNAPTNLTGTSNTSSIALSWTASSSSDVAGYTIFRAESGGAYNTLARNVTSTSYDDNTASSGVQYYYKVKAVDNSLNTSGSSNEVGPLEISGGGNGSFNGTYSMIASHSGKALDTYNWGTSNGTNIVQWNYWGGDAQRFNITTVDGDWHRISPVIATGQGFDVDGVSTADGANIHTWSYWGGDNQQFRFEDAGSGDWRIIARHSGKCLNVMDSSQEDGANVVQWACVSGNSNQEFELISHNSARNEAGSQHTLTTLAVYPNPASNRLNISLPDDLESQVQIAIYNSVGQRVVSRENIKAGTQTFDLRNFSKGMYIVKVSNSHGTNVMTKKFTKE